MRFVQRSAPNIAPRNGTASLRAVLGRGPQGLPGSDSPAWTALTAVTTDAVRQAPDGSWIKSLGNRTTRATFDATEETFWVAVSAEEGSFEQRALTASIDHRAVRTISPLDAAYGAVGDDTADDRLPLNAAIAAAASFGAAVDLRGLTYKVTDTLTIPAGTILQNGTIHGSGTGKKAATITGDNVTIKDVSFIGRHGSATASASEYAIFAEGTSAAAPMTNLRLERVSVELFGQYGIWLKHVDGFAIINCDLGDLGYAAIIGTSAKNGFVLGNRIENVLAGFSSNGYGITFGREETNSLVTDPHSQNIVIANNLVNGIPWNGIDTHGGQDITICDNVVLGCKSAIAVGSSDNASNVQTFAPVNVSIKNNVCDSLVTDGSALAGILFTGAAGSVGSPTMEATGSVTGNTVTGHGDETDALSGGIYLRDASGVTVTGNTLIECAPHGIVLYHDVYGVTVVGNTVVDQWSDTHATAAAVYVASGYVTGTVSGNTHHDAGNKAGAVNQNERGYYAATTTGVAIEFGGNYLSECASAVVGTTGLRQSTTYFVAGTAASPAITFAGDPDTGFYSSAADQIAASVGGTLRLRFLTTGVLFSSGYTLTWGGGTGTVGGATDTLKFFGGTGSTKPAITGSRGGNAALADLLTKLATLGLIADSTTA